MNIILTTTESDLQDLWKALHGARRNARSLYIPKDALHRLLIDHTSLYTGLMERRWQQAMPGKNDESVT